MDGLSALDIDLVGGLSARFEELLPGAMIVAPLLFGALVLIMLAKFSAGIARATAHARLRGEAKSANEAFGGE